MSIVHADDIRTKPRRVIESELGLPAIVARRSVAAISGSSR